MESQTVAQLPPSETPTAQGAGMRRPERAVERPLLAAVGVCVALAALSALVLATVPSYDPWAWITWGREVFDPHLSFVTGGGPSWKPLPVFFTAVYGLFGGAAPKLWVVTARAGGLLGLVAAYRLGVTLAVRLLAGGSPAMAGGENSSAAVAGGENASAAVAGAGGSVAGAGGSVAGAGGAVAVAGVPPWAAPVAGVIAAAAIVLTQDWAYYMFRGTSEPMLVAASLWAIERHLAGRRGSAFVLLVAAALIRPEAWPFLLGYGVYVWLRAPRLRLLVVAGLLAIPLFWFVPPWIGSGQPFLAASHAKSYNGHLGADRLLEVLRRGADLQVLPALIAGLLAAALAWWRGRDRVVLGVAAAAVLWWVLVVAMTLDGYPGLERFFLPAAAVTCVLAAASIVTIGGLVAEWVRGRGSAEGAGAAASARVSRRASAVGLAVVAALVAVSIPLTTGRISTAWGQRAIASRAVTRIHDMGRAAAAVGDHAGVFPCQSSVAAVNHGVQTALAWRLHVTLPRVGTSLRRPGVLFVGPHDTIDGGPAPVSHRLTQRQLVARVAGWRVYRVTAPGAGYRCVGG